MSSFSKLFNAVALGNPEQIRQAELVYEDQYLVEPYVARLAALDQHAQQIKGADITQKMKGNGYNIHFTRETGETVKALARRIEDYASKLEDHESVTNVAYSRNRLVVEVTPGSDLDRLLQGGESTRDIAGFKDLPKHLQTGCLQDSRAPIMADTIDHGRQYTYG